MRIVTTKELSNFKILPYDLYNEANQKILSAGEVLTPGKLIMLKNNTAIYTEDIYDTPSNTEIDTEKNIEKKKLSNFSYESIDIDDFETVINRDGVLQNDTQIRVKYFFRRTLDLFLQGYYEEGLLKCNSLANIIYMELFKTLQKSEKGSRIRFMGEYELCHPLNVAIVAGLIAQRVEYNDLNIEQVILAGLLHDVGKLFITLNDTSPLLTLHEEDVVQHTTLGYEFIKDKLNLDEKIARGALEHHENNDGSGYPNGLSSDYISELAQMINVANYYDNLACNRTSVHITRNRDALRAMLEMGTKKFSAKMLYTFVHMFNYDDPKDFNDMVL